MGSSYPLEALKAQSVAARTYAIMNGTQYEIAQVVDNTFDQAYYGMSYESDAVISAVNVTHGEVVVDSEDNPAATFYSASAGGMTADSSEVWHSGYSYLKSVPSPDEGMSDKWYRVLLSDGRSGYVHGSYVQETGQKNAAGYAVLSVTDQDLNVRTAPTTFSSLGSIIAKLNAGDRVIALEPVISKTPYIWERDYTAAELAALLTKNGTPLTGLLTKLEVTRRGPSGRALEVKANGQTVKADTPDSLRSAMGSLPSTLFDIVETGRYTIIGAGQTREKADSAPVYALGASGNAAPAAAGQYYIVGTDPGSVRAVTAEPNFVLKGRGYGHGIGMSQYGARNYALQGLTYVQIIKAYYSGVNIVKE
jgi:stage II sporulation protein D